MGLQKIKKFPPVKAQALASLSNADLFFSVLFQNRLLPCILKAFMDDFPKECGLIQMLFFHKAFKIAKQSFINSYIERD